VSFSIGSLFAGIGGLELGLEWAGLGPTLWQVERDPFCRAVLAKHWPDATRFDDVTTVRDLPHVDLICGGFPCQDLSYAGTGAGLAGARSGLWSEFARIVRDVRPRFVVVENVPALLARGLGTVLGDLAASGYDAQWDCIRAADVGAHHRRDRIFIVAHSLRGRWESTEKRPALTSEGAGWVPGPGVARVADGVPRGVDRDRLRALGNAVVPQVAREVGMLVHRIAAQVAA
jgi:DNA (cytosine-5)-methyltransferase 1